MRRIAIAVSVLALLAAACSGTDESGVASLTDNVQESQQQDDGGSSALTDEESILAFAACMRENGVEDFEDPDVDAEGGVQFRLRGATEGDDVDRETLRAAFDACDEFLGAVAFGGGAADRSEIEDQLYEFAACMRENGIDDFDDPDFSATPGEGGTPFGEDFDPSDPQVAAAMEACQATFGGLGRLGGGGQGRGPGQGEGGQNG